MRPEIIFSGSAARGDLAKRHPLAGAWKSLPLVGHTPMTKSGRPIDISIIREAGTACLRRHENPVFVQGLQIFQF